MPFNFTCPAGFLEDMVLYEKFTTAKSFALWTLGPIVIPSLPDGSRFIEKICGVSSRKLPPPTISSVYGRRRDTGGSVSRLCDRRAHRLIRWRIMKLSSHWESAACRVSPPPVLNLRKCRTLIRWCCGALPASCLDANAHLNPFLICFSSSRHRFTQRSGGVLPATG